jgi:hypothetical protein
VFAEEKAGLKPEEALDGGGRGGSEAPEGGGYDMMNFAVRPRRSMFGFSTYLCAGFPRQLVHGFGAPLT